MLAQNVVGNVADGRVACAFERSIIRGTAGLDVARLVRWGVRNFNRKSHVFFPVSSTLINRKKNHYPIPVSRCNGVLSQIVWARFVSTALSPKSGWAAKNISRYIYLSDQQQTTRCPIIIRKHGSIWPLYTAHCVRSSFMFEKVNYFFVQNYNTFF